MVYQIPGPYSGVDALQRSVFFTVVADPNSPNSWADFGSLQFSVGKDAQNNNMILVIYRSRSNQIVSLSDIATVTFPTADDASTINISMPRQDGMISGNANPDISYGFSITIQSWGSDSPSFTGTVQRGQGQAWAWKGQFLMIDTVPLEALLGPPFQEDPVIKAFLAIEPTIVKDATSTTDQAKEWGNYLFQDIMLHCISQEGQDDFLKELGPLGTWFAKKCSLPGGQIDSSSLLLLPGGKISIADIQSTNQTMFEISGVHVLAHALKSTSWLDPLYQAGIHDLLEPYLEMLVCPEADLPQKRQEYGINLQAAQQIENLRTFYKNAATRCYLGAWICFHPELGQYNSADAQAMYDRVTAVLRSEIYRARGIAVKTDASANEAAASFQFKLGVIYDKLVLLKMLCGYEMLPGSWENIEMDINKTMSGLVSGGIATGFFGANNVRMQPADFALHITLDSIYTDGELSDLWTRDAIMRGGGQSRNPTAQVPYDYRSAKANQFLVDNAKSLGLYTEPPPGAVDEEHAPPCVIL